MMRLSAVLFLLLFFILPCQNLAAQNENQPYTELAGPRVLAGPDDGRVEVISFFWYGCGTCYRIDGLVSDWAASLPSDVRFIRKHVAFNPPVDVHARVFTTLRAMGLGHEADLKVFNLFIGDHEPVNTLMDLPRLAKALKINEKKLIETFNSSEVDKEMAQLDKLMLAYNIEAVPTLVIDGKYVFNSGQTEGGPKGFLAQADSLISQSRKARKAAAAK